MTSEQQLKIKGYIMDTNNYLNRIFPSFNSLNYEISPGTQLIDIFSSYFSFYHANHKDKESKTTHIHKLDECVFCTSNNFKSVSVVSDAGIKNNVAMSISHVYSPSNLIKKTIHHTVNIMSTEVELFTIRCGINQAIQIPDIAYIIMDAIYVVHHIFDSLVHLYQY